MKRPSSSIAAAAGRRRRPRAAPRTSRGRGRRARARRDRADRSRGRGARRRAARRRARARGGRRRRGVARRARRGSALRVERTELAQVLVRLLEVPADRLVVLGGVADPRLDPVGEAAVQLGARALEQAPVGRVADQHVVEAQHRLAEEPAGVALDQLAAPQRLEPRVELAAFAAAAARRRRCARSGGRPPRRARARCAPRGAAARCAPRAARGSSAASRARRDWRRRSSARPPS